MTIEGYFDGTAVRPLEPVELKVNQRVFINVLDNDFIDFEKRRTQEKLDAIHSIFGILSEDESRALDESIQQRIKLKEVEL